MTLALPKDPIPREIAERINALILGRINTVGTVTLVANATTTTVTDENAHRQVAPILIPTTANAAAALATTYVSARGSGTFTLTHANAATTDRTFIYVLLG